MATALYNGASKIIPVDTPELCIEVGKQTGGVTAGDRDGKIIPGLSYGNSPSEYPRDFIENKILEEEVFKKHKENINNNDYESLLYRLVHKIPLINLNIVQENGLDALTDNNRQKIESGSFGSLNNLIDQNFFNRDVENIDELNSDIIYDILLPTLNSDEN